MDCFTYVKEAIYQEPEEYIRKAGKHIFGAGRQRKSLEGASTSPIKSGMAKKSPNLSAGIKVKLKYTHNKSPIMGGAKSPVTPSPTTKIDMVSKAECVPGTDDTVRTTVSSSQTTAPQVSTVSAGSKIQILQVSPQKTTASSPGVTSIVLTVTPKPTPVTGVSSSVVVTPVTAKVSVAKKHTFTKKGRLPVLPRGGTEPPAKKPKLTSG